MAYNANKNKEVNKKPGAFNMYMHPHRYKFMRGLRKFVGTLVVLGIIFLLLSGAINQVKTGESILKYILNVGQNLGTKFESLFTEDSPLKVTEDGVYFKDADVPDNGALDNILPNDSNSDTSQSEEN